MCIKYYEGKDDPKAALEYGAIKIQLHSVKEKYPGLVVRKLAVSRNGGESKMVKHLQELKWEDNSRPDKTSGVDMISRLTYMLNKAKKHRTFNASGSVIVHCRYEPTYLFDIASAGCGRTGTFIALYNVIEIVE